MSELPALHNFYGKDYVSRKDYEAATARADALQKQLDAVRKWGEDNKSLIDYVQDMGCPTFQQALEQKP